MSKKHEEVLRYALLSTGVLFPVESSSSSKSVSVLSRSMAGQDSTWVSSMGSLLRAVPEGLHLSKKFVLKDDKIAFGWHVTIEAGSAKVLSERVESVRQALTNVRPSLVEQPVSRRAEREVAKVEPTDPALLKKIGPPRAPGEPGLVGQVSPGNFAFTKQVTERKVGQKGNVTIVEEMPLPHVYSEMNRPNAKGRGAKAIMEE